MGYIKVAYRKILEQLDNNPNLPKKWDKFVRKQEEYQNLIIKSSKNKCHCTNCNFDFISKKKINEITKCPNCHCKLLIKRSNIKYYEFRDYLSILNKVDNTFIIRYFELKTIIDAMHKHSSSIVEFAREIIKDKDSEIFINEKVSKCMNYIYIYHSDYYVEDHWRKYARNYSLIDASIVFPYNIKKLFSDTVYKYSCIWDLAKHCLYIDLSSLLIQTKELGKVEILTKMKLYNLALKSHKFEEWSSFENVFGVSKDYYYFMKRNNITYRQLKILRILKEKDISKIRYLEGCLIYEDNISILEDISKYINLNRFIRYSKMHHRKFNEYTYRDYLKFAYFLDFDLKNNKYAFPKDLKEEHDKLEKQYEIQNKQIINNAIIKRAKKLSTNMYKDNTFIIIPASSLKDLQDESKQQNNCVRTYAKDYAEGECDIYFMRNIDKPKKSLVTVEVQDNKIVQSRIKNNKKTTKKQEAFLNKWENKVLKKVA